MIKKKDVRISEPGRNEGRRSGNWRAGTRDIWYAHVPLTHPFRSLIPLRSLLAFFFFFQAQAGIRDWSVTGVQTCALPISPIERARADQCCPSERWCARGSAHAAVG